MVIVVSSSAGNLIDQIIDENNEYNDCKNIPKRVRILIKMWFEIQVDIKLTTNIFNFIKYIFK